MITGCNKHKENEMVLLVNSFNVFQGDVFQYTPTSDTFSYLIAGRGINFNISLNELHKNA
jgi:hypothetical protein